jgi:murein DD-endopeptidase MepM/ murein hydrolase activator NlpD
MPPIKDVGEASRQLEAMLVRQLIASSGVFKGNGLAGSQVQTDMFVEALADAVAKAGGFGLAGMLERSLGDGEAPPHAAPHEGPPAADAGAPHSPPVSSGFGRRLDPLTGEERFHTGLDLRAAEGTAITAAAPGVVRSAGPRGGYGNAVEIDHGGGVTTLYAHASSLAVKVGDQVAEGDMVGRIGQTGRATGPHLHFEVRKEGRPVDPQRALNAYGIRAEDTIGGKATGRALK